MILRSDKRKTRNQMKSEKNMAKSLIRRTNKVCSAKQKQKQCLQTRKNLMQIVDSEITFNFKKEIPKRPLPNNNDNIPNKHPSTIISNESEPITSTKLIQGMKFSVSSHVGPFSLTLSNFLKSEK